MFMTPIHHAGIVVTNLARSLSFYRDILGWKVLVELDIAGEEIEENLGLTGIKGKAVMLQQAEGVVNGMIELLEFSSPRAKPFPPDEKASDIGLRFLSFRVKDIEQNYNKLKERGVKFHSPPQLIKFTSYTIKACIFRDPDGVQLEMVQFV